MGTARDKLIKLLQDHSIHQDVTTHLTDTLGAQSLDDLATIVENRGELQAKVLDGVQSQRAVPQQLFRLKQAWRIAQDEYDLKSERRKTGWAAEDIDAPLDSPDQEQVHTNFKRIYKFGFRSHDCCADGLFGRIYRESQKWNNTFVKMEKVKDQRLAQMVQEPRRSALAPSLLLLQGATGDGQVFLPGPMQYLHGIRVYTNMLAVAGTHQVESKIQKDPGGQAVNVFFCPYDVAQAYASFAEEKVLAYMKKHPNAPGTVVLAYLRNADEQTRTRMMELVRSDPKCTVGEALPRATTDSAHEWTTPQRFETRQSGNDGGGKGGGRGGARLRSRSRNRSRSRRRSTRQTTRPAPTSQGPRQRDERDGDQSIKTVQHLLGDPICKAHNDRRGCREPCPQGRIHCCDVQIGDNRRLVCGRKDHSRFGHTAANSGSVSTTKPGQQR